MSGQSPPKKQNKRKESRQRREARERDEKQEEEDSGCEDLCRDPAHLNFDKQLKSTKARADRWMNTSHNKGKAVVTAKGRNKAHSDYDGLTMAAKPRTGVSQSSNYRKAGGVRNVLKFYDSKIKQYHNAFEDAMGFNEDLAADIKQDAVNMCNKEIREEERSRDFIKN